MSPHFMTSTSIQNLRPSNPCRFTDVHFCDCAILPHCRQKMRNVQKEQQGFDLELVIADIPSRLPPNLKEYTQGERSRIMGKTVKDLITVLKTAFATRRNSFYGLKLLVARQRNITSSALQCWGATRRFNVRKGQTMITNRLPSSMCGLGDLLGATRYGGGQACCNLNPASSLPSQSPIRHTPQL